MTDFTFGMLAQQDAPCLSLYQSTHRHYPGNQQDPIRFRNLTKALAESLEQTYHVAEARALLKPFRALAHDCEFWNHSQHGLAVLGAPGFFRVYRLQRPVPERVVVASSFHLKPLIRILQSAEAYHVLALNLQEMRLFEGNRDDLEEIQLIPGARTITEALGDEYTEPHLTVASYGGSGDGRAQRHGHGSRKDEIDIDTGRFFRAVDRCVVEHYSRASGLPLMLAALTEHHAPFRRISRNPFLLTEGLHVDPAAIAPEELCQRAWRVVEPRYLARVAQLVDRFGAAQASGLGADDLGALASAAVTGRNATLLIDADCVVPGGASGPPPVCTRANGEMPSGARSSR